MLTIIRTFKCGVRVDYKNRLEEILNEFRVTYIRSHYHECEYKGEKIVNVYFDNCSIIEDRFEALIKRLNELPLQANAILKY